MHYSSIQIHFSSVNSLESGDAMRVVQKLLLLGEIVVHDLDREVLQTLTYDAARFVVLEPLQRN